MALAFRPDAIRQLEPSSDHLCTASAVIVPELAAELPPPTPTPVAEAFVMVLVGFGGDWAAIWRLPAMVRAFRFCVRSFFFAGLVRGEGKLKVNLNFSARHDLSLTLGA